MAVLRLSLYLMSATHLKFHGYILCCWTNPHSAAFMVVLSTAGDARGTFYSDGTLRESEKQ